MIFLTWILSHLCLSRKLFLKHVDLVSSSLDWKLLHAVILFHSLIFFFLWAEIKVIQKSTWRRVEYNCYSLQTESTPNPDTAVLPSFPHGSLGLSLCSPISSSYGKHSERGLSGWQRTRGECLKSTLRWPSWFNSPHPAVGYSLLSSKTYNLDPAWIQVSRPL